MHHKQFFDIIKLFLPTKILFKYNKIKSKKTKILIIQNLAQNYKYLVQYSPNENQQR